MNDDTKFLIRRMDTLEHRVLERLDKIDAWRNRMVGLGILAGGIGSFLMEVIIRKLL